MKIRILPFILLPTIILSSCTNDSTDDLVSFNPNQEVKYSTSIKNIIDNNCLQCHGTTPSFGAPMSLTTYEEVKDAVLNRGLINRISRAEGSTGAMPLGGQRLPQVTIDLISQWEDEGLAE